MMRESRPCADGHNVQEDVSACVLECNVCPLHRRRIGRPLEDISLLRDILEQSSPGAVLQADHTIFLTFDEIEAQLGADLPVEAYNGERWWKDNFPHPSPQYESPSHRDWEIEDVDFLTLTAIFAKVPWP